MHRDAMQFVRSCPECAMVWWGKSLSATTSPDTGEKILSDYGGCHNGPATDSTRKSTRGGVPRLPYKVTSSVTHA